MTWLGGIILCMGIGAVGAMFVVAILLVANDKTHLHCADPDEDWK